MTDLAHTALGILAIVAGIAVGIVACSIAEWIDHRRWQRAKRRLPYLE